MFLMNNRRIAALITVISLALLVFCRIEREARRNLAPETKIDGLYSRQPARPTGRLILTALAGLQLIPATATRPPPCPDCGCPRRPRPALRRSPAPPRPGPGPWNCWASTRPARHNAEPSPDVIYVYVRITRLAGPPAPAWRGRPRNRRTSLRR